MGKTLGKILEIGSIVALGVVTAGTGAALALGVGSLGSAIGFGVGAVSTLTGGLISASLAGSLALAGALSVGNSLFAPSLPKPDTAVTAIKNPIPPRVAAYGRSRLYGAYTLYETSGSGVAVDVFAMLDTLGIPIDAVERLYLGDQNVASAAGVVAGLADGSFGSGAVEIDFRLGAATETAFSKVVGLLPGIWTNDHRGDGVVSAMVTWQPVKAKDYQKVYPNQQPALSMVARWQRVFDWRDPEQSVVDPSTWTWSENVWLQIAHYILTREKTLPLQPGENRADWYARLHATWDHYFAPTLDTWTLCVDDADSAVPLKAGGTEPRYRSCVSHKLTDPHKDTKARLLACCDGWICPREDGALIARPGRYVAPTVTINGDAIVSYSLQDGVEDESAVNEIPVTYVSDQHDYNTVDADAWRNEDDILFRGAVASQPLSNDVPSNGQARRLAKRAESKAMAAKRGTVTTNEYGRIARGERFINLPLIESGHTFYEGPAEITDLTRNLMTGGVTFKWIAADPNIDQWLPEIEEGDPAPVGDRVAPEPLDLPTIISATPQYSDVGQTPDGVVDPGQSASGARILVVASGPSDRGDLTWYVRWRVGTSGPWTELQAPDADPGPGVSLITGYVPLATNINVEVSYSVGDGRVSDWSNPTVVDTTVS